MSSSRRIDSRPQFKAARAGVPRRVVTFAGAAREPMSPAKPVRLTSEPTRWIMAVVFADRGTLSTHAREAIAAAALLSDGETAVMAVVLGPVADSLAETGADRVAILEAFDPSHYAPERAVSAVCAIIGQLNPDHLIIPDCVSGDGDLGRRLIAELGWSSATQVTELSREHVAVEWQARGVKARRPLPRIVLVAPGIADADLPFKGRGEALELAPVPALSSASPVTDVGLQTVELSGIALIEADAIVAAGHGVNNTQTLKDLADALGAAVGASRVAVDEGKFPRDRQIGASGQTVSATTYIAAGISGAVQHLQGIKACKHVIAINSDPGAPIVKRSDLTLIGDAEEIMAATLQRLSDIKRQQPPETS